MITNRIITYTDYNRLMDQLYCDFKLRSIHPASLHRLYLLLETSRKCTTKDIPEDVITMNSQVIIRFMVSDIKKNITICYPNRKMVWDAKETISIYDPLGLALLGRKENDIFDFIIRNETDMVEQSILVEKILFQPEASGLFIL